MDIIASLKDSNFFQDLTKRSLEQISGICIPRDVAKKENLFSEGDRGQAIFLLVRGAMQLYKLASDGREVVVKTLGKGEVFAEVILFEENRYPVSARALSESRVFILPRHQVHCLLLDELFRNDFIKMLMRKQRYLTERILYLTAYDLEERFFQFISDQYGRQESYTINLSKKDFAASIGTIPETFSRLLNRLEEERKIVWQDNILKVADDFWNV
jgi:CRP-like cAMP-binding protein